MILKLTALSKFSGDIFAPAQVQWRTHIENTKTHTPNQNKNHNKLPI